MAELSSWAIGTIVVLVLAYVVARLSGIGWYRSKLEYQKSIKRLYEEGDHVDG